MFTRLSSIFDPIFLEQCYAPLWNRTPARGGNARRCSKLLSTAGLITERRVRTLQRGMLRLKPDLAGKYSSPEQVLIRGSLELTCPPMLDTVRYMYGPERFQVCNWHPVPGVPLVTTS